MFILLLLSLSSDGDHDIYIEQLGKDVELEENIQFKNRIILMVKIVSFTCLSLMIIGIVVWLGSGGKCSTLINRIACLNAIFCCGNGLNDIQSTDELSIEQLGTV